MFARSGRIEKSAQKDSEEVAQNVYLDMIRDYESAVFAHSPLGIVSPNLGHNSSRLYDIQVGRWRLDVPETVLGARP